MTHQAHSNIGGFDGFRAMRPAFGALLLTLCVADLHAQANAARQWTNQQGRAIQAVLVKVTGDSVVLRLPNGVQSTVAVAALSKADQAYLQSMAGSGTAATAGGALEWPKEIITIDPKKIVVTPGKQDEEARQFHYSSGTFEFIANAPLAGTVMSEVASDFELLKTAFARLPWGWTPKPKEGTHFQIYLTETEADYIAMGGTEGSSADTRNNKSFIRFSALGLKKVGAKYQYDVRQKEPGRAAGLTTRVIAWDYRTRMAPWALNGLETFMRYICYQANGTAKFVNVETELKRELKERMSNGTVPDTPRMLRYMHQDWNAETSDAKQALLERKLDALMLFYFFGYLDGKGSGAGLHEYYRTAFEQSGTRTDLKAMLDKMTAGRDDAKLSEEIKKKFQDINLKIEK